MDTDAGQIGDDAAWRSHAGIPIRNLWMLLVYAAGLAEFLERFDAEAKDATKLPDLVTRLLIVVVERRLKRTLSRGYRPRAALLARVRGRIDWLATETGLHLQRGQIACRFEEQSHDTPRNRLVRSALQAMESRVRDRNLAADCRGVARALAELGVSTGRPSRSELSQDHIARHESDDRVMVAVANLALDTIVPSEMAGEAHLTSLNHDEHLLRRIFEGAVAGLYRHELHGRDGWQVWPQAKLKWDVDAPTAGMTKLLPSMAADLIIDWRGKRRLVIDTKFTGIVTKNRFGGEGLKSFHIYQLYAYLHSQTGRGDILADGAEGILLHPAIDVHVDEAITIQGHRMRFVTVDLSTAAIDIRNALLKIVMADA